MSTLKSFWVFLFSVFFKIFINIFPVIYGSMQNFVSAACFLKDQVT